MQFEVKEYGKNVFGNVTLPVSVVNSNVRFQISLSSSQVLGKTHGAALHPEV